jgi:hypothetical protein
VRKWTERKRKKVTAYELKKIGHYCTKCGKKDAYTLNGRAKCFECQEKVNEYRRNKSYDKKYAAKRKAIRDERKSQGLCIVCGEKAVKGRVRCLKHLYKDRRAHKPKELGRELARELGICMTCLKHPALSGHKICKSCYETVCKNLITARNCIDKSKRKPFYFGKKYGTYLRGEQSVN